MLPFDLNGTIAVLGTGGAIALGLTVWLASVVLRALFGGRQRAASFHTCCGCLVGLLVFTAAVAVPVVFFGLALASA